MKRRVSVLAVILLLCLGLAASAQAAGKVPEIAITWLSGAERPSAYNRDLNWLTVTSDKYEVSTLNLETGEKVDDFVVVFETSDGLILATVDGPDGYWRYGFINKSGEIMIPLEYDGGGSFTEGLAGVMKVDAYENNRWGYIDKTGKVVVPMEYDYIQPFAEGLAAVMKEDARGYDRWGYIDKTGRVTVPLEYDDVRPFSDGLATVMKIDDDFYRKHGYIDKTGEVVIPLQYYDARPFSEGLAAVEADGFYGYRRWGYIDKAGEIVVPLEYDDAGPFSEGLAAVMEINLYGDILWGYIDKAGEIVIPMEYNDASVFFDGVAIVMKEDARGNEKWGCINRNGEVIVPLEYDDIGYLSTGMFWAKKGARYGIFESPYYRSDSSKNMAIPAVIAVSVLGAGAVLLVLVFKRKKGVTCAETEKAGKESLTAEKNAQNPAEAVPKETIGKASNLCSCGAEIEAGANFCFKCGRPLGDGANTPDA
ncbi:WG repeat-containing protein [Feifania hominis]|uniref:WG repeat-containing protein n=1 Tax=Feifania hominis TaxID=2763660 RepID=A0A926DDG4_9FIRM|nr:WG repeat-containing protein [Feifania hominis]MBC8535779.1 WG repeat-containing protein [Feifania hominis]